MHDEWISFVGSCVSIFNFFLGKKIYLLDCVPSLFISEGSSFKLFPLEHPRPLRVWLKKSLFVFFHSLPFQFAF
jgi:hypothetical protein